MKYQSIIILSLFLITLAGCNPGRIHKEYQDVENFMWEKNDVRKFIVAVEDESSSYNISFALRHIYGLSVASFPIKLKIEDLDGVVVFDEEAVVEVMNSNGDYVGDGAGDLWDIEQLITGDVVFPAKGSYTISVSQEFEEGDIPFIMEVGLLVDKAEEN